MIHHYIMVHVLLLFLLCFHTVLSVTTHMVEWDITSLTTINNRVSVCAGDTVNITCTGCSSSILLAETIEEYNSCMSPCTQPQDHIGTFSDMASFITVKAIVLSITFDCDATFALGESEYFLGENTTDCDNGLKLEIYLMTDAECIAATITTTTTTTTTTTSSSTADTTGTSNSNPTSSSTNTGSVTVTPTSEGVAGDSNRSLIGVQFGIIAGVVVFSILVVCVVLGMVICVVKLRSHRENVTLVKDESNENMLESVDGKGITKVNLSSGSTANTPNNKVKPMAVSSPNRPSPAPPGDKQNSSNGSASNKTASTNDHGVGSANGDHSKKDIPITTNEAYEIINREPVLQDNIAYEPINTNQQDTVASRVYETVDVNTKTQL